MQNKYILEEAYYNSMNKNPVYVVLMNGGTPLSKIISGFTGDTYTHACISFNAKLKPLYSFGLTNDSTFGFAVANPRDKKAFPHIDKYAVYVMYVSNHQLYKMKKRLKWFIDNGKDLKFDFPALVSVFFQKDTENHSDKYFCSRFVAEILKMGEVDLEKKASLYRPESLLALSNISLVNWGRDIIGYNWIKTRDNERLIKQNRYVHPTSLIPKFESVLDDNSTKQESCITEAKIPKSVRHNKLFFLSDKNMNNKTLTPRTPNNYFTKNGYEDAKTKRVCFAPSIDKALMGLSANLTNKEFYVHVPIGEYKTYKPTKKEVPDSKITGEIWITNSVKVICIGKIVVIKDKGLKGHKFKYGDKEAELYDWSWKWVEKYKDIYQIIADPIRNINESVDKSELTPNFKKKSGINFEIIDIHNIRAKKYLRSDKSLCKNMDFINKARTGEIAIDKKRDKLAGYIFVSKAGTIQPIHIYEDYRGYGLSETLLKDGIQKYNATNLGVYSDNEVAVNLYKKFGFKQTREKNYKDGEKVIFMELDDKSVKKESVLTESDLELNKSSNPLLNNIIEFNAKTNVMEYIIPNNGNIISNIDCKAFLTKYRVLSPEKFKKYNGGICWDYVIYESYYFNKNFRNVPYKAFYHSFIDDRTDPAHTFILFYLSGKVYWFESSFKDLRGVYEFANESDALSYITRELYHVLDSNTRIRIRDSFLTTYNPVDTTTYNMTMEQYIDYMFTKPKYEYMKKNNPRYIRKYLGTEDFDDILEEDSKHDYEKYNYGDKYVKNLRKVDILKSQLKKGKITQEEFDREYAKLSSVKDEYGDEYTVPRSGTKKVNYNRPNKNKPDDSFKNIDHKGEDRSIYSGKVSDTNGEKFDHYNEILKRTENYNDYKTAFKNLTKLLGKPNACTIKVYHGSKNGKVNCECFDNKKPANCTSETKLYHTTTVKGLTRLDGKFRGGEGFYFSSKRVYFHKDNPGGRQTNASGNYTPGPGEYVYEFVGNPSQAYVDPEIKGSAVFIETDTSVPVKDVTDQFRNKETKESVIYDDRDFDAILEDSYDIRVRKAMRYKNNTRLFVVSKQKLGDILKPKSYKVNGKQENFCIVTHSIQHALMMLGEFCLGKEYFVYQTEDIYDLYNPKDDERIYPKCVSEVWIKSPVKISYMKKIKVTRDMFYPKYRNNPPEDIGSINNPYTWNTIETGVQHDSTWIKESVITESKSNKHIYFISDKNMDCKVLSPRIPDNYFTRHGYEDTKTKRVCFAPSIDKSLMALSNNITGKEFYVHIAIGEYKVYKPTVKQVPDSKVTGELWVTKPVEVSCIGKIKVISDMGLPGHKFSYGDKEAELYDWKYEWIEKFNSVVESCNTIDSYITESNQKSTVLLDFKKKSGIKFAFIDIHDSRAKKYLDKNSFYKKNFKKIMSITNGEIAVDVDNDKLAGYIYVGAGKKGQDKNYGFIQTLEVLKQYRGYGLSNKLLDDAIKKYNAVDLTVYKDNEVALKLYKKHGFVIIGYGNSKDKSDYWMKLKTKLTKDEKIMDDAVITEACKNPREARRFVQDVEKLAKKYNANYFLVTDGASGTNNKDNKAVKYCRDALKEWERKNKFNPDEDWRKNPDDFSDYKLEETMLYEFANKELLDKIHVTSDVELSKWMKSNIKYQEFKTLMTPEEVFESRRGSCHDQVVFELAVLKALKYSPKTLFFIEYNDGETVGGQTHSLVYYRRGNNFFWFENAWGDQAGIHGPYKNVTELKNDIISKHDTKKYKKLQFSSFRGKAGMTLDELVKACLK